jgi:transcription elongation factor Elf1
MSSHTARYASVAAIGFGVTSDLKVREEARAAFALATCTVCNKYLKYGLAINFTGIDYFEPWFSDSYFDCLSHIFDGMAEMSEMAPDKEEHQSQLPRLHKSVIKRSASRIVLSIREGRKIKELP